MSTFFSDHFGADGTSDTTLPATPIIVPPGIGHGRMYMKRAFVTALATTDDTIRMMNFREEDRLFELLVSAGGESAAGALDLGLYEAGANHDGALVDPELFASDIVVSSAIEYVDKFAEEGTVLSVDRGKRMWEIAAVGDASYTARPNLVNGFDIVFTPTTSMTTTAGVIVLVAKYTSGS